MFHADICPGGLDYTGVTITKEFEAFSQVHQLCLSIPILEDGLVEDSETFLVNLTVDSYPELQNERLQVRNTRTQVTIQDSSKYLFIIAAAMIMNSNKSIMVYLSQVTVLPSN